VKELKEGAKKRGVIKLKEVSKRIRRPSKTESEEVGLLLINKALRREWGQSTWRRTRKKKRTAQRREKRQGGGREGESIVPTLEGGMVKPGGYFSKIGGGGAEYRRKSYKERRGKKASGNSFTNRYEMRQTEKNRHIIQ